ncbi:MAG: Asp-tRNA(Asn)/Glu-tRNA(Gln) amidotransferase subunit GatB, partial [Candidatus Omnitrophica bacterium]|nr:Asp-tRNA(Asn)/Glu-tRNA(Gln) amidotransferase subunit GatB [Candidatus Omnitrophota bacterium]
MYEPVIGLEVHAHLATETKAFCGCANKFGASPNTLTCPVCLGFPGSLPVFNRKALDYAVKAALALNCRVNNYFKFDRKNYYYPDLPKNYQISQYDLPLSVDGYLDIELESGFKKIPIKRVHMEEDAGKLVHAQSHSLVDYNRSGVPLIEIVTDPAIDSPGEAYCYLMELKEILEYLGVSDCDMEKGSLRCDANVSVRLKGETVLGTKVELKNMNSFKAVKEALAYEIERLSGALSKKEKIIQETRLWDVDKSITVSMRSKEEAHDYRYFPDPDLASFTLDKTELDFVKENLPELPRAKRVRFEKDYALSRYDAGVLTSSRDLAGYFEECLKLYPQPKVLSNWITTELLSYLNEKKIPINKMPLTPKVFVGLLELLDNKIINRNSAKDVLKIMLDTGKDASIIIKEKNLFEISDDSALDKIAEEVIAQNSQSVADYKSGKENAVMFLVGQIMKKTGGKA